MTYLETPVQDADATLLYTPVNTLMDPNYVSVLRTAFSTCDNQAATPTGLAHHAAHAAKLASLGSGTARSADTRGSTGRALRTQCRHTATGHGFRPSADFNSGPATRAERCRAYNVHPRVTAVTLRDTP